MRSTFTSKTDAKKRMTFEDTMKLDSILMASVNACFPESLDQCFVSSLMKILTTILFELYAESVRI
jgi:hypothetical protein